MSTSNPTQKRKRLGAAGVLLVALAVPMALLTLFSLEPLTILPQGLSGSVSVVGQMLIQIVTIVGALAVIIGILNLTGAHVRGLRKFPQALYSLVALVTLVGVVVIRILERLGTLTIANSAAPAISLTLMDAIQVAVESALAGILFFFLVYTAYRLMRRQTTIWSVLFVTALVLVLLGHSPVNGLGFLSAARDWLLGVPVNAGTRGLLLGVAIGTLTVGIRLLIGQDRTFRE